MVLETEKAKESKTASCKKVFKNECSDCEKFQRKIKENERTVSARDVLIEMSQKEIQKLQNLYKNSIDEYETLRFTYCSTVQDFTNLKDIHKKLEEEHRTLLVEKKSSCAKLKDFDALKTELDYWRNQYEKLQKFKGTCDCANKEKCLERKAQTDILNIQNILQNQNQSVKLLLSKFLDELKESKPDQANKNCQAGCKADNLTSDKGLREEIDNLNSLVEKLTVENKKIKENLNDKQTHLFKCLNVLEKNHSDIGNLSGHIENICTERDKCLLAIDDKDQEISRLKSQLNHLKESTASIEDLRLEKERYFQENKKLRTVIDTFRAETEKKDKFIDEVDNEKEHLHKELGRFRRLSEALQDEIQTKFDPGFVEELKQEIETLKTKNQRYVDDLDKLTKERIAKEEELEELSITVEVYHERIKKLNYIISSIYQKNNKEEEEPIHKNHDVADNDEDDELEILKEKYTKLQQDMVVKQENQNEVERSLREKIKQLQENVNDLDETLSIITEENRSNLKTIENLRKSLSEAQKEQEKIECRGKCVIHELRNEIEDLKTQLEHSKSPKRDEEIEKITEYGEPNEEFEKLQEKLESLKKDLESANLEISEYEEENKAYRQKLEAMNNDVTYLQEEKLRTEDDISEKVNKLKHEFTKLLSEKDDKIVELQNEIAKKTGDPTATQAQIAKLRENIKTIEQEKSQLESEKTNLIGRIVKLESELEETYHETGKKMSSLVGKLESLEEHDDQMKKQLKCCCEEITKIKENLEKTRTAKDCNIGDFATKCMIQDAEILKLRNINLEQAQQIDNLKNSLESNQKRLDKCDCGASETEDSQKENEELRTRISDVEDLNEELRTKIGLLEGELCSKKCMIISLEKCIDKSNIILGDCEEEIKKINAENQSLKNDLEVMKANIEKLNCEIDVHRADKDLLQEKIHQCRTQSQELEAKNVKLVRKTSEDQKNIEGKISVLQLKYNKLLEESGAKDMELDKIKKQFEVLQSCCKSPSITKEEFQKMKKVSREIKDLLIEQSKKLNQTTEKTAKEPDEEKKKCFVNKYVAELEAKIKNKEADMKYLESKNNSMSTEVLDLKQHVHTLMLDNIELKREITNLLNTVINKVRLITTSGESLDIGTSKDTAATGVLNSLIQLERGILEDSKPNGCPISSCNCMSLIKSRYSLTENGPLLSKPPESADEDHGNVVMPKVSSAAECMREISKAYGICYESGKPEPEKEVKPEKNKCTSQLDHCASCEAQCSDVHKIVHCSEKKTEEQKPMNTPKF